MPPHSGRTSRVLFVHTAEGTRLTGAPRMIHHLVGSLDRDRFQPVYVTPGPTDLSRALEADGVDVRTVPLPPGLNVFGQGLTRPSPLRALGALRGIIEYNRRLLGVIRDFDPDLVWASNLRTFLSIFPAATWHHVPVVWNIWLGQRSRGLVRLMNAVALRRARRIVTEYEAQAGQIFTPGQMERARPKIRTVYTGHEVPEFSVREDGGGPFVVGTMGAFSPRKDQRTFLEAARLVHERAPDVRFRLAGAATTAGTEVYEKSIRTAASRMGLDDVVDWCGWIDRPTGFLGTLDVYVQSSRHEGLPGAVREAMLHGLPVIGTDVGGTREAVADGETGCLVPAGDARSLADAILRLRAAPAETAAMGRRGRDRAARLFSREAYLKNYQEVLDEALLEA